MRTGEAKRKGEDREEKNRRYNEDSGGRGEREARRGRWEGDMGIEIGGRERQVGDRDRKQVM